jgi:DNA-binding XRE family transcriptional regulator
MATEKKNGRPTKYKPEYDQLATNYCLLGATNEDLAKYFEVSHQTINTWFTEHPSFLDAIKKGREDADANVAKSLYQRALGYSHKAKKIFADAKSGEVVEVEYTEQYPPEVAAAIFWLKNRQRDKWRDKTHVENEVKVTNMSEAELNERIADLAAKTGTV